MIETQTKRLMITNRGCRPVVGQPPISCSINNNTPVTGTFHWLLSVFFDFNHERQTYKYSSVSKFTRRVSDILHLSFKLLTASTKLITINLICISAKIVIIERKFSCAF